MPDTDVCPARTLDDLAPGARFRVRCLKGGGGIRQRLLDAGILPGTEATVLRMAPLADPIEIRIGDTFVTLRRREAAMVGIDDA
jgi:ferrous iron transport protein A